MTSRKHQIRPSTKTRSIRSLRACWVAVVLVAGGCATGENVRRSPPPGPPATVLALPSGSQRALAADTGIDATHVLGRRDTALGGAPTSGLGPSVSSVRVWNEQRVVNGRVYTNLRWRARSYEVRTR